MGTTLENILVGKGNPVGLTVRCVACALLVSALALGVSAAFGSVMRAVYGFVP